MASLPYIAAPATAVTSQHLSASDDDGKTNLHLSDEEEESLCGENEENTDFFKKEVTALFFDRSRLGCARFVQSQCRVEAFEVPVRVGTELASASRAASNAPCALLTDQDVPASLLWLLQYLRVKRPTLLLSQEKTGLLPAIVQLVNCCEVVYLNGKAAFDARHALPRMQVMYPHLTEVEFDSRFAPRKRVMRAVLAAMLHFATAVKSNISGVVEGAPFRVMCVEPVVSQALQITRTELHPCDYQGTGRAKEGLSLFTFVDRTQSVLGRALLRQWFALPSCSRVELLRRQSVVRYFAEPARRDLLLQIRHALHRVKPTGRIHTLMRQGRMSVFKYQMLHRTIVGLVMAYDLIAPIAHELPFLFEVAHSYDVEELRTMAALIEEVVEGVASGQPYRNVGGAQGVPAPGFLPPRDDDHIAVNVDADPSGLLRELRVRMSELGEVLRQRAETEFQQLSPWLRSTLSIQCLYKHPHGYVLGVDGATLQFQCQQEHTQTSFTSAAFVPPPKATTANGEDRAVDLSTMERVFQYMESQYGWAAHHNENGICYFKTPSMVELDSAVGDLQERIYKREDELRNELDEVLLYRSLYLLPPSRALAELDCLLSFAYCAVEYQWCCPQLVAASNVLRIQDGWHPVLGRAVVSGTLTPFSLDITRPEESVCLVTGPNGSGKSILLGAVAHIVFLAHLGSFVPATQVAMSLYGSILTIVTDNNGLGFSNNSSFAEECISLNKILRLCDAQRVASVAMAETQRSAAPSAVGEGLSDREAGAGGEEEEDGDGVSPPPPLILLDELGRGTAPEDGEALLGAVIRYFCGTLHTNSNDNLTNTSFAATTATSWQHPVVLCTTHFTEMLHVALQGEEDDVVDKDSLPFPFEHMQWYVMQCVPVYQQDVPLYGVLDKSFHTPSFNVPEGGKRLPVDIIPSFTPLRITQHAGQHKHEIASYLLSAQELWGGPIIGRQSGLPAELVGLWEESLYATTTAAYRPQIRQVVTPEH